MSTPPPNPKPKISIAFTEIPKRDPARELTEEEKKADELRAMYLGNVHD